MDSSETKIIERNNRDPATPGQNNRYPTIPGRNKSATKIQRLQRHKIVKFSLIRRHYRVDKKFRDTKFREILQENYLGISRNLRRSLI
jgi:hypothetical protein